MSFPCTIICLIVAIEHAELLLHQFKCLEVLEVLDKVPEVLSASNEDDRDVQQLIAIFRGVMKIKTEGIYEPALEDVKNMKREWASKSVDEYTDIQVSMGIIHESSEAPHRNRGCHSYSFVF